MNYHYQIQKNRKETTFPSPKTIKLILNLYISHQFNTFLAQIGGGGGNTKKEKSTEHLLGVAWN